MSDILATMDSFDRFFDTLVDALDENLESHGTVLSRDAFPPSDAPQREAFERILKRLTPYERKDLARALDTSRVLLASTEERIYSIRTFEAGDMGIIASRQSLMYRNLFGWNERIEVNEGEVTTAFLRGFAEGREQCWVADMDGVTAGSVFLTDEGNGLSRLRLLYVEPFAQGRGIGDALVSTCVAFAERAGYGAITLWTHSISGFARRIYAKHGFTIVATEEHSEFGPVLLGETWRLEFGTRAS